MTEALRRHTLVWLPTDHGWLAQSPALAVRLRAWFGAGHPAIVARRAPGMSAELLQLGVPLPPDEGKQRLSLSAPHASLLRCASLPALDAVTPVAPTAWQVALRALQADAGRLGLMPRVFGALAWQALTSLPYLHARSDVDLLWEIEELDQADTIAALLSRWETRFGLRADGECRLPDGTAFSWREYASGSARLLIKTDSDARLVARSALAGDAQVAA
ncbi:phosphoribosyl-dephospho-CoA transferase [Pseudoxanthomonas sp. GM95]|uniref:malonate decarboxylase holo-[acyl-carrier-protein] synthase n=1 Tax=Pseudoxanthomonas sp. GM95 TaxID=1881043 RepID=UPI0008D808F5|nr:phosphoribosyl-dephospho-CoA transferase [Pseudoxanthomonas sp. GM95]